MWTLVLLADFILEFRLEYLWPCWLFFGSVYTTFHCHGLVRTPAVGFNIQCSGNYCIFAHLTQISVFLFLFSGHLCCFCLRRLHTGYLLFNFCPFALAIFCGKHLCVIQLHLAHRWVCGLFVFQHMKQNIPNSVLLIQIISTCNGCTAHLELHKIWLSETFSWKDWDAV